MEIYRIFYFLLQALVFDVLSWKVYSTTDVNSSTSTTKKPTVDVEEKSGNPTWIIVAIVLFVSILVVSLTISLSVGIYKYRRYHKRHGLYKKKSAVDNEPSQGEGTTDYDMFVVQTESSPSDKYSQLPSESPNVSTTSYIGFT